VRRCEGFIGFLKNAPSTVNFGCGDEQKIDEGWVKILFRDKCGGRSEEQGIPGRGVCLEINDAFGQRYHGKEAMDPAVARTSKAIP
jgi:hypothetical protein